MEQKKLFFFENFNVFANIYTCFLPLSMTRGGANDPAFSVDLTSSTAIFHSPEILQIFRGNCYTSQGDPDSSFPLWPGDSEWIISIGDYVDNSFTALGSSDPREVRLKL